MKQHKATIVLGICFFLLLNPMQLPSDILDTVKEHTGSAVRLGTDITKAPVNAVVKAARPKSPGNIFRPFREIGRRLGDGVDTAATLASRPEQELFRRVQQESKHLGRPGEFIFDVGTFSHRFYNELTNSGARGLANVLRQQNPFQLTAAPLAAAIRAARERHISSSKPLPNDVRKSLSGHFDKSTLDRAKYAVGSVEITLPNFIGQRAKYMGDDYAVVVDDIIVFNMPPSSFSASSFWWTHEVAHVDQYRDLGVERFAYRYLTDYRGIESEADAKARAVGRASGRAPVDRRRQLQMEHFVAQCVFENDPYPVNYLISSSSKIVAMDPVTGRSVQVGWVTPPRVPGSAWTYYTPNFWYAVDLQGNILTRNAFGQPVPVGYVIRIR